ncbi:MAG: pilus assembly PilX N-terminal domain-containing protein [Desulfuromonadales bacterium]|nr:pilus assembly PilX N-terminal domain-containing protein [Desulfuromonadales bacterium]
MTHPCSPLSNERGSVLILALLILVMLTIIGMSATTTTNFEVKIAANERQYHSAFYAAEAGLSYVLETSSLYNDANIDPNVPLVFPLAADAAAMSTALPHAAVSGTIRYEGAGSGSFSALRGSGYSAKGTYRPHVYQVDSTATLDSGPESQVRVQAYRIGF